MRVIYHDVEACLPLGNATPAAALGALLQEAVVTPHAPQTERTRHMIDVDRLAQMKVRRRRTSGLSSVMGRQVSPQTRACPRGEPFSLGTFPASTRIGIPGRTTPLHGRSGP